MALLVYSDSEGVDDVSEEGESRAGRAGSLGTWSFREEEEKEKEEVKEQQERGEQERALWRRLGKRDLEREWAAGPPALRTAEGTSVVWRWGLFVKEGEGIIKGHWEE